MANADYVVKIEPHSNGPLFVEIHCLINAGKPVAPATALPPGMPAYIASGSHYFGASRYRFLILRRYQCDLAALVERRQLDAKAMLCVAVQIIDVLEHLHDRGYAHSDIKAANLMLGTCTYERPPADRAVDLERVKRVEKELRALLKQQSKAEATPGEPAKPKTSKKASKKEAKVKHEVCDVADFKAEPGADASQSMSGDDDDGLNDSTDYRTPQPKKKRSATEAPSASLSNQHNTSIPYSGTNPMRSCRLVAAGSHLHSSSSTYQDMLSSHYLRQTPKVDYGLSDDSSDDVEAIDSQAKKDKDFVAPPSLRYRELKRASVSPTSPAVAAVATRPTEWITEDRIHLIDFGLAIKFVDSAGQHRPFFMDARRAHDGTLEFTSRDAHMGAHSRRSDLECFGYNLLYWTQGWLPWKEDVRCMQQPEQVHRMKEFFMTDITVMFRHVYGREVPTWIGQFMRYVGSLAYHDRPDYELCRNMFRAELRRIGVDVRDPNAMRLRTAELRQRPVRRWEGITAGVRQEGPNGAADADAVDGVAAASAAGTENVPGVLPTSARNDVNKSMMKLGLLLAPVLPFREVTAAGQNRISPKNLRSKSEKVPTGKRKNGTSVFSWTDILSTDPDQIARQRADKEFDRVPAETPLCQRYKGKPTYAILEVSVGVDAFVSDSYSNIRSCAHVQVLNRIKFKDRLDARDETPGNHVHRSAAPSTATATPSHKRPSHIETPNTHFESADSDQDSAADEPSANMDADMMSPERRKPGLRTAVRHTPKSMAYRNAMLTKRRKRAVKRILVVPHSEFSTSADEESSSSNASSSTTATTTCSNRVKRATKAVAIAAAEAAAAAAAASDVDEDDDEPEYHQQRRRQHVKVDMDDETSRDTIDYSPVKTRRRRLAKRSLVAVREEEPRVPAASVMQRKAAMRAAEQMSQIAAASTAAAARRSKY